jgi:hypothetical protein
MPLVSTEGISACHTFSNVKFLGGFASFMGQLKFESLTLFRDVNHEGVDTVLVPAPVDYPHTGLTYIMLRDRVSVSRIRGGGGEIHY